MGFFSKLFGSTVTCPACGRQDATDSFGGVRCRNPECGNHAGGRTPGRAAARPPRRRETVAIVEPVTVYYTNRQGVEREFTAERRSFHDRRRFVSCRVAPTGIRIALRKENIRNPGVVQEALALPRPPSEAMQVIHFHSRRGTTSPLYERLLEQWGNIALYD